jgi:ATP-dependent RNA helicase SUPV3L1/SUV3
MRKGLAPRHPVREPSASASSFRPRGFAPGPGSKLVALLGPTNTGKTHRALQHMLEHQSGMIGLPLRLLAREVYDRVSAQVGEQAVALVTGEEKRIGKRARYWICTVEAMPLGHDVDFLAVDEIQLAEHAQRGHVFTDRLLNARGRLETWFMGAETIRPLCELVLPAASIEHRPRLSKLSAKGQASLGGLPARSAVVAFSVPEVYRLADALRRRRGGAAVVLGALSPRARNAQVALYESREVDYLVATDAIGMGLNLNIRHVAFAGLRKFDGRAERPLTPAELGQVAGRAGRHLEHGSFGTLAPLPKLPDALNRALEEHRFPRVEQLVWRNSNLALESVATLLEALRAAPPKPYLRRVSGSSDQLALERLSEDPEVQKRAHGADAVRLLWEACQVPDYDQGLPEQHAALIKRIFLQLTGSSGCLNEDWLAQSLSHLNDTTGDLDALTWRIASLRTWTYLSNHAAWLADADHWRRRTEEVEDRLSDALHARLVDRFVERRRAYADVRPSAAPSGATLGSATGKNPFETLVDLRDRMLGTALPAAQGVWLEKLTHAPHERFEFDAEGSIFCDGQKLAQLLRGSSLLRPEVKLCVEDASAGQRLQLSRRLLAWSRDLVEEILAPLRALPQARLSAAARGLLYQLEQGLGTLPARGAREQLAALGARERALMAQAQVELGRDVVYARGCLSARALRARQALCRAYAPQAMARLAPAGDALSFALPSGTDPTLLSCLGFVACGPRALRADLVLRLSRALARCQAEAPSFELPQHFAQWLACAEAELPAIVAAFGYRRTGDGAFMHKRRLRSKRRPGAKRADHHPRDAQMPTGAGAASREPR